MTRCTFPAKGRRGEADCGHRAVATIEADGAVLPRCRKHCGAQVRRFIERYPERGYRIVEAA